MKWNLMKNVKINANKCRQINGETTIWEDEEVNAMQIFSILSWAHHRTFRNSAAIFILCFTGMRLGELLSNAVEWFNLLKKRNEEFGINPDYVIATTNNNMVKLSSFIEQLQKICKYANVTYRGSHACRRTYITTCLDALMPIQSVSRDVGHLKITTTQNTYYKVKESKSREFYENKNLIFSKTYTLPSAIMATLGNTQNERNMLT